MRSLDVIDEIIGFHGSPLLIDRDDQSLAVSAWSELVRMQKRGQEYMPMSPHEVAQSRRVLAALLSALDTARARKPVHLEPVASQRDDTPF